MSLLDDLRRIEHFPPSHLPSVNEVLRVVGVLAAYVEHGDALLEAVDADAESREKGEPASAVDELLSPPEKPEQGSSPPAAPAAASPAGAPVEESTETAEERVARLEQELANARAVVQRTQAGPPEPVESTTTAPNLTGPGGA